MKPLKTLMIAALTILSVTVFAQDKTGGKIKTAPAQTKKISYSCPMHKDVTSSKPGKCSRCGMDLAKSSKEQMKMSVMKIFVCPMHPEVTSHSSGKCSACNMNLVETVQTAPVYSCSMHPEVTSKKAGKCSKCGMALAKSKKEQMKMETMKNYTCPMHPEVTSSKPGKCTSCGMALAEKKTDHSDHQH